jgi:hypothetical protein
VVQQVFEKLINKLGLSSIAIALVISMVAVTLGALMGSDTLARILRGSRHGIYGKPRSQRFREAILAALDRGVLDSEDQAVRIFEGVSSEPVTDRSLVAKTLKRIFADMLTDDKRASEHLVAIAALIRNLEAAAPFSVLPDAERQSMQTLEAFIHAGDKEPAERELRQLARLIQARAEELRGTRLVNRLALPVALIGVVATIAFGLAQLGG